MHKFGARVSGDILDLHYETERIPPKLENYDAWGNRIDRIETCNAWKEMKNISATEGLISIPYEKKFGSFSRLYQVAKLYLFAPSSGLYTCPLAMTDGAAKSFQVKADSVVILFEGLIIYLFFKSNQSFAVLIATQRKLLRA